MVHVSILVKPDRWIGLNEVEVHVSILVKPDRWIGLNEVEVHLVAQQLPNIAYPVPIQSAYFQRY
jgi:hypothetical protein